MTMQRPVAPERGLLSERLLSRIDTVVHGKYRIERVLGVGGMGAVYSARHRNGHRVAIKFLHEHLREDPDMYRLFAREAYIANEVQHPGAVQVLDDDIDEQGCAFLVMPELEGISLRARWERAGRRLPLSEVGVLMLGVLDVLESAHAKGIIHRDIKPDNLFVTSTGDVCVLDFGIARRTSVDGSTTITGRMVGTLAFMPPEQALAQHEAIGPHSDCWAVGATMFALLSGEFVHPAENAAALFSAAATQQARSIRDVLPALPDAFVAFLDKALAFDATERWSSARMMHEALERALEESLGETMTVLLERVRGQLTTELAPTSSDVHEMETDPGDQKPQGDTVVSEKPPQARMKEDGSTLIAGMAPPKPLSRRNWIAVVIGGLALLVVMVGVYLRGRMANRAIEMRSRSEGDGATSSQSLPLSSDPEALAEIVAGIQQWRDASEQDAEQNFGRALERDPDSAAAHLYSSMIPTWTDEGVRKHHHAASAHRGQLGDRDRALLDGYAPAMRVPINLDESLERLAAARNLFPTDWLITYALADVQIKRGEHHKVIEIVDEFLLREPSLPVAWSERALAFALLDDLKSARDGFQECLNRSPHADTCLHSLVRIELNEGRCEEAERYARILMDDPSPRAWSAYQLALAIQGRGAPMANTHALLEQAWHLVSPPKRHKISSRYETLFRILEGEFRQARRHMDEWEKGVASSRYEAEHSPLAAVQIYTAMELGERPLALRVASEYLSKREAWFSQDYLDLEIMPLGIQYRLGGLSREGFRERRRAWIARQAAWRGSGVLGHRWAWGYAMTSMTRADAVEALAVLPDYRPMVVALSREADLDWGIGHMYLLAGDLPNAIAYLRRGARSCTAVRFPFEHTWANLELGTALEQTGDMSGACAAYDVVLSRWGKEPRSVSAKKARARRAALHCPPH